MCNPVITQYGYDSGLILECQEHKTYDKVVDEEGTQVYTIDLATHMKMEIVHKAQFKE